MHLLWDTSGTGHKPPADAVLLEVCNLLDSVGAYTPISSHLLKADGEAASSFLI